MDLVNMLRARILMMGSSPEQILAFMNGICPLLEQAAASLATKDKEIERLRAADPRTSLLTVIANIRKKSGVGGKPMLDELAAAIAERLTSKERALAEAVEVMRPFASREMQDIKDAGIDWERNNAKKAVHP